MGSSEAVSQPAISGSGLRGSWAPSSAMRRRRARRRSAFSMRTVRLRARMVREVMRAGVAARVCWAVSVRRRNWARDSLKARRPSGCGGGGKEADEVGEGGVDVGYGEARGAEGVGGPEEEGE